MDLRYQTEFAGMGICDVEPEFGDMGIPGSRLLVPGEPDLSVIPLRMMTLDARRMPPLGSHVVDDSGVALISEWITSLSDCESPSE